MKFKTAEVRGLPGFDVLTFQFISFKTPTRLLLAAYVPTEENHVQYLRNPPKVHFGE